MTLDELEDKFELDELQRRHEAGEKLDDSDYCRLAKRHYKWNNIDFPDFEDMADEYSTKYPIRKQRISAFKWQLNEFEKRIIDLDPNNPVEAIMISDWNFGKKCRLTIEQLEQEAELEIQTLSVNDAIGGIAIPAEGAWQLSFIKTLPDLGDLEVMIEDAELSYTQQLENYRTAYKQWQQNKQLLEDFTDEERNLYFNEGYGEECLILIKHIEALRDDQIKEAQLSSLPKMPLQNISEEPAKFETNFKRDQLEKIHDILSEELNYLTYNREAWLYWFNKGEKPKNCTLEWRKKNAKQSLADIIHMLTIEKSNKKPVIRVCL